MNPYAFCENSKRKPFCQKLRASRTVLFALLCGVALGKIGLEIGQPKLLAYLDTNGPCKQSQLAEYFDVDSAAISRMLDSLEKGDFITRQPSEQSRRCNLVNLTAKGQKALQAWRSYCQETEDIMLCGFSPSEQRQFADFLFRAYQNLRIDKEGSPCTT